MVIPNKVFQILAAGRPLITADTPAIRELLDSNDAVCLIPAGDAIALKDAVLRMRDRHLAGSTPRPANPPPSKIFPPEIGRDLFCELERCVTEKEA
jgi:glycosyltransferase involved in cell wall biosynthesis